MTPALAGGGTMLVHGLALSEGEIETARASTRSTGVGGRASVDEFVKPVNSGRWIGGPCRTRSNGVRAFDGLMFTESQFRSGGKTSTEARDAFSGVTRWVTVTAPADLAAPELLSASAGGEPPVVYIAFSKPVSKSSAETGGSHQIDKGVTIRSASLSPDGRGVSLAVSPFAEGETYILTASGVTDRSAGAHG